MQIVPVHPLPAPKKNPIQSAIDAVERHRKQLRHIERVAAYWFDQLEARRERLREAERAMSSLGEVTSRF